ncbi:MAG TPA: hypothetical protein O0X38_03705, partial [Methanocorpusculum sp.]|nr:hypothetical protein [Methanocorpusculum sp.]
LHLTDGYFEDEDTASEEVADAVTRVCRVMRDTGAAGHVLLYDGVPDAMDQEHFFRETVPPFRAGCVS